MARITADWGLKRLTISCGTCYLLDGNVVGYVDKDFLVLRVGESAASVAIEEPFIKPYKIADRTCVGWIMLDPAIREYDDRLQHWLRQARSYIATLAWEFYGQYY